MAQRSDGFIKTRSPDEDRDRRQDITGWNMFRFALLVSGAVITRCPVDRWKRLDKHCNESKWLVEMRLCRSNMTQILSYVGHSEPRAKTRCLHSFYRLSLLLRGDLGGSGLREIAQTRDA